MIDAFVMEGLFMKGQMDTELGRVLIDEEVIKTYAGSVAVGCLNCEHSSLLNIADVDLTQCVPVLEFAIL